MAAAANGKDLEGACLLYYSLDDLQNYGTLLLDI